MRAFISAAEETGEDMIVASLGVQTPSLKVTKTKTHCSVGLTRVSCVSVLCNGDWIFSHSFLYFKKKVY